MRAPQTQICGKVSHVPSIPFLPWSWFRGKWGQTEDEWLVSKGSIFHGTMIVGKRVVCYENFSPQPPGYFFWDRKWFKEMWRMMMPKISFRCQNLNVFVTMTSYKLRSYPDPKAPLPKEQGHIATGYISWQSKGTPQRPPPPRNKALSY